MKYFRILTFVIVCHLSSQGQSFSLNGHITGCNNQLIFLTDINSGTFVDSTNCIGDEFTFKGVLPEPKYISLGSKSSQYPARFFIENSNMTFKANIDSLWSVELSPSEINETFNYYNETIFNPVRFEQVRYTIERNESLKNSKDSTGYREWMIKSRTLVDLGTVYTKNFIKSNSDNFLSLFTLRDYYTHFGLKNTLEFISEMPNELQNTPTAKLLVEKITRTLSVRKGVTAPAIVLKDINGGEWTLNNQKGKLVFVNFWASWCGPCRVKHPALVNVFNKYNSDGIQFVSISIDDNNGNWLHAIEKDKLTWTQLIDTEKKDIKEAYGVYGVPANFLIDRNGEVVKKDFSVEELDDILKMLTKR
jgi:thiol-disulfide isomerase/thioredoxin